MKPKTIYRLQYNTGELSAVIQDDKPTMKAFAELVKGKKKYPVAIWKVIQKKL